MKKLFLAVFAVSALSLTGCGLFACPAGDWETNDGSCCPDNFPFYYNGVCWQVNYSVSNPPPADAVKAEPVQKTEQSKQ